MIMFFGNWPRKKHVLPIRDESIILAFCCKKATFLGNTCEINMNFGYHRLNYHLFGKSTAKIVFCQLIQIDLKIEFSRIAVKSTLNLAFVKKFINFFSLRASLMHTV